MSDLKDFKAEINKCSKCGLCQAVCPVYKATGNECAVSRGKFVMLDGVLKGDLKLNKNINKYLDMCLKCGKCSDFCPSGIDVCKIFETAKNQYMKKTRFGKLLFFLQNKFFHIKNLRPKFKKTGTLKLLYFRGCVNNFFPDCDRVLAKIPDIEIIERDFECCGIPLLSSGNLEGFEALKTHNLRQVDCDFDYVFTNCASCESTLKQYLDAEFINLGELLIRQGLKFKFPKPIKITFHKPCHLKDDSFLKPLLANCENVEYVEMKDYDECCGFAGEFAIKNPKISMEISKKKAKNIINTGADCVITTCPACILGLNQGLIGHKIKVKSLSDFLAEALIETLE